MGLFFVGFSVFPEISFGDKIFKILPQPGIIGSFFGTFRSTGRFIWPVVWLCTFGPVALIYSRFKKNLQKKCILSCIFKKKFVIFFVSVCMLLQFYDLSAAILDKKHSLVTDRTAHSDLDESELISCIDRYSHIVMTYDDNIEMNNLAFFAYRHNLTMNRYYFSRGIDRQIEEELQKYRSMLDCGENMDDYIFVLKEKNLPDWSIYDLHFYHFDNTIVGVTEPIEGLQEIEI